MSPMAKIIVSSMKPGDSSSLEDVPQKLQKGALLYSSAQYPTKSVQLCVGLLLSVGLCTQWPKTETWNFFLVGHYIAIVFSYTARRG